MDTENDKHGNNQKKYTQSFWRVVFSVLAAAFGVQKREQLEKDFNSNSALPFIIAGLVFTAAFVLLLVVIVHTVLEKSTL